MLGFADPFWHFRLANPPIGYVLEEQGMSDFSETSGTFNMTENISESSKGCRFSEVIDLLKLIVEDNLEIAANNFELQISNGVVKCSFDDISINKTTSEEDE